MATKAKEVQGGPTLNAHGYAVGIPRTLDNLNARLAYLQAGIEGNMWADDMLTQAKHLMRMAEFDIKAVKTKKAKPAKAVKAKAAPAAKVEPAVETAAEPAEAKVIQATVKVKGKK